MASAKVVIYARLEGHGWRRGTIVMKKGEVVPNVMDYAGVVYPVADPTFQVRTYVNGTAKYTTVPGGYAEAKAMMQKYTFSRDLEAAQVGLGIIKPEEKKTEPTMAELVEAYIKGKMSESLDLSPTTIRHYQESLRGFLAITPRQYVSEVTKADVVSYMDDLTRQGYSQKTRADRYTNVRGFLRNSGVNIEKLIDKSVHSRFSEKPEGDTTPFGRDELETLYTACDEYHAHVYRFLVATGLRYREANHLTWADIDTRRWVITLPRERKTNRKYRDRKTGKMVTTAVSFKTKSRRKREVPVFASIRPMLMEWRAKHPDRVFVFGSISSDMPDNHWLEYGKRAWKRAGLNCGTCDGCAKNNECEKFFLHRARHTFAHRCLDEKIGIHKVSAWMGHHDVSQTMIYLSNASTEADCDPFAPKSDNVVNIQAFKASA